MPPSSTPPPEPEPTLGSGDLGEFLDDATELAVAVARRDAATVDAPPPPASLRPYLRFSRFPPRARSVVVAALDDDDFRARVVATASESDMDRASWLYLARPEGWNDELAALVRDGLSERRDADAARREQAAERKLEQVSDAAERARSERDDARAALERAESELARLRAELDEATASASSARQERSRAVRELKDLESLAAGRLADLREARDRIEALEAALEEALSSAGSRGGSAAPSRGDSPDQRESVRPREPVVDEKLVAAVSDARRRARELAGSLEGVAELLGPVDDAVDPERSEAAPRPHPGVDPGSRAGSRPGSTTGAAPRRVPLQMRSGVVEDTPGGLRQLLERPDLVAIVDGYNVSMLGWPQLDPYHQRQSLMGVLGGLQARSAAALHVVFDGAEDGARPAQRAPLSVRLHFSAAGTEADDYILDMVERVDRSTPVLVISSDRRVADGARALGANTASSATLLALVRA